MDIFSYLLGKKAGGGGGEAVLVNKDISANGTYNASSDSADGYKKVVVDVPNTYAAGDEGKVVSDGALVSQGSDTVTQNGTVDTTLINSLTVNVTGAQDDFFDMSKPSGRIISNVTSLPQYAIIGRTGITDIEVKNLVEIQAQTFRGCSSVQHIDFGNALLVNSAQAVFYQDTSLLGIVIRGSGNDDRTAGNDFARGCTALQYFDAHLKTFSQNGCFNSCSNLKTIILRKTSVTGLGNIGAFSGTPFDNGGTGGDIYIPKSLYDHLGDGTANDYKAATNWSTINGYGTITWHAIEGSIYETQYADGTSIS